MLIKQTKTSEEDMGTIRGIVEKLMISIIAEIKMRGVTDPSLVFSAAILFLAHLGVQMGADAENTMVSVGEAFEKMLAAAKSAGKEDADAKTRE